MGDASRTTDVTAMLRAKFAAPQWAFFEEVRNATGFEKSSRYCDGLALGLWPSNGLELIGFEVKVSRGDWARELANPAKANEFFRFCDRWYVVAPEGIVKRDELPSQWGLLEAAAKGRERLLTTVPAPKQPAPAPLDRGFIAALGRHMHTGVERLVDRRISERYLAQAKKLEENERAVQAEHSRLLKETQTFLRELGDALGLEPHQLSLYAKDSTIAKVKAAVTLLRSQRAVRSRIDNFERHGLSLIAEAVEQMRAAHQAWRDVVPEGDDK